MPLSILLEPMDLPVFSTAEPVTDGTRVIAIEVEPDIVPRIFVDVAMVQAQRGPQ